MVHQMDGGAQTTAIRGMGTSQTRRGLSLEWVQPPELLEAPEFLIGRCKQSSMFHRECGKDCVRYQRTICPMVTDGFSRISA